MNLQSTSRRQLMIAGQENPSPLVLDEAAFGRMIAIERKRAERSRKPLLLMLMEMEANSGTAFHLRDIFPVLLRMTRETDIAGWYRERFVIGVLLTELTDQSRSTVVSKILSRVSATLGAELTPEQLSAVRIGFHWFPEEWNDEIPPRLNTASMYPELEQRARTRRLYHILKRGMDVAGSALALLLTSPLFLMFALAIKLTSRGPVFFRQERVGQFGQRFRLYKFRSMHHQNDHGTHKAYVRQLIAGVADKNVSQDESDGVYKLLNDSRITRIGAFLRRTSLDELPQFINVLKGEMSLVGPRPPIDYEVESYELWHRARLLEAKPGITGLWQVNGRNRLTFDDMVRMDLRYARTWSPWLDLKILFLTPKAMLEGAH